MHTRYIVIFTVSLLVWASCSKDSVTQKVEPPVPVDTIKRDTSKKDSSKTDTIKPVKPHGFERKKVLAEIRKHYAHNESNEQYFLGSIWHLKDTSKGLQLESLDALAKKVKYNIIADNSFKEEPGFFEPSYQSVLDYANKFKDLNMSSTVNFTSGTFSDYAIIQSDLGHIKDIDKILSLVRHGDSTTIQKPHNTFRHALLETLTLYIPYGDYSEVYPLGEVDKLTKAGYSPYALEAVTYGTQIFLMGESDSTRVRLNTALDKLFEKESLDPIDINVLDCSNLLMYYRGGGKDTFIQYPKGTRAIKNAMSELLIYINQSENIFNYPLHYTFISLEDHTTLRYHAKFDVHVKK